jgi:uncharacterized damage-inducible protein DinB
MELNMNSNLAVNGIIKQYDFNLLYAKELTKDLDDHMMTIVPSKGLDSHPAFTLGHLVTGSAMMAQDLGTIYELPYGWDELFARKGPVDQRRPDLDASKYPDKEALLAELEKQHNKVKELLTSKTNQELLAPVTWRLSKYMPTMLDLVFFMCITHENMHLGQLAAWRRAMDLPSSLAAL